MNTLDYILSKYEVSPTSETPMPIKLRLSRHGGLTRLFHELGFRTGAEIGVEQGKYSEEICRDNPGVKLYCVDPWMAYLRYRDEVRQSKLDGYYREAIDRLLPYGCAILKKSSVEAALEFEPGSLDFVYIDGNHDFEFVVFDIIEWSKRVRPGGIVAGHDYRDEKENSGIPFHVIQAVQAYTSSYRICPWFILGRDKCPSWLYVKT